jgi:hypothetical protein
MFIKINNREEFNSFIFKAINKEVPTDIWWEPLGGYSEYSPKNELSTFEDKLEDFADNLQLDLICVDETNPDIDINESIINIQEDLIKEYNIIFPCIIYYRVDLVDGYLFDVHNFS